MGEQDVLHFFPTGMTIWDRAAVARGESPACWYDIEWRARMVGFSALPDRFAPIVVRVDAQNRKTDDTSEELPGPVLNSLRVVS